MPTGILRSRTTVFHREQLDEEKHQKALLTLFRIRDDLDPEQFTRAEFIKEFDTPLSTTESSFGTQRVNFDVDIPLLIEAGLVEKIDKSYRVTDAGMDIEKK